MLSLYSLKEMTVRNGSYVAAAGTALALNLGLGAGAQGPVKSEMTVRKEPGPPADAGVSNTGVQLLGGTVCLPGTGMVFFSGPPDRLEERNDSGGDDRQAGPEADKPPANATEDGKTGSDAGGRAP